MSYHNPPPHLPDDTASRSVVKGARRFGAYWQIFQFVFAGGLTFRYSARWSFDWLESAGMPLPLLYAAVVGLVCGLAAAYGVRFLTELLVSVYHKGVRSPHSPR